MVIELTDDMVKEIVLKEMAEILDDKFTKEDVKYAATRIVQYYLRADEYERFTAARLHEEFKNLYYPA